MQYGFGIKMVESFNTLIYNVKGLQNKNKRLQIFDFCKSKIKNNGLVMLQETHSCKRDEKVWKKIGIVIYFKIMEQAIAEVL